MANFFDTLLGRDRATRAKLHEQGYKGYSSSSLREFGDSISDSANYEDKVLPKGAGVALAAGFTVLAVAAGVVALPEIALIAGVGYLVGNKMTSPVTGRVKKFVNETLDAGKFSDLD